MYGILDLADANWCKWFFPDEMLDLKGCIQVEIEYPPLPQDMQEFLKISQIQVIYVEYMTTWKLSKSVWLHNRL